MYELGIKVFRNSDAKIAFFYSIDIYEQIFVVGYNET